MKKKEKINEINAQLLVDISREKAELKKHIALYYQKIADLNEDALEKKKAAWDDDEEENAEQSRETVWLDGSQNTAMMVARRVMRRAQMIPEGCEIEVSMTRMGSNDVNLHLSAYNKYAPANKKVEALTLYAFNSREEQIDKYGDWENRVAQLFEHRKEEGDEQ